MTDTPSCKSWRGKYPVVLTQVFDDMFWKARVSYEEREEIRYKKNWDQWRKGNYYENQLKKAAEEKKLKDLLKPQQTRQSFSNLTLDDIKRIGLTPAQQMCLTKQVRDSLEEEKRNSA